VPTCCVFLGHVLKIERGKDRLFPSAYDGVVHLSIQLRQGSTLPKFLAIREEGQTLLNATYVFSDLHKKVCFRYSQLAHLGQYCRAAVKPVTKQGAMWSFMDVPAELGKRMEMEGARLERESPWAGWTPLQPPSNPWGVGGSGQGVTPETLGVSGGQPSVEAVVEGQAPTEQVVELWTSRLVPQERGQG
jgi:hypothetical protein